MSSEFQPDKYQAMALKTFNTEGDDPINHALLGLAGETGELLDLWKKNQYKPGFSWWNCKKCGFKGGGYELKAMVHDGCDNFTPLILDELGDYSYYARIVSIPTEISFEAMVAKFNPDGWDGLEDLLIDLSYQSIKLLKYYRTYGDIDPMRLQNCVSVMLAIMSKLGVTLEQVLNLNYAKLNSEPTAHGWRK